MVRIRNIEAFIVDVALERAFLGATHPLQRIGEIIVKVHTDEGITGIGNAHGTPMKRVAALIQEDLAPMLIGQDALDFERHWQQMFSSSMVRQNKQPSDSAGSLPKGVGKAQLMAAIGGIDIALWDILGQACGKPVWQLLGGARTRVPAYATGGYYREDGKADGLEAEFGGYVEQGFRAVKLKAGGLEPEQDVERARVVRDTIGPDVELYIDATRGWTVDEAIRAGRLYEELDVAWFEEPVPWYDDVAGLAEVARHVRIPITAGESEYTKQGVRDLILRGGIRVTNFDCTKGGGLTDGRKIAAIAEIHNVAFAPHHAAHIHAHLVAGVPNGLNVEVHPDPVRDPLWERLYAKRPILEGGDFVLDRTPGLGLVLDEEAMVHFGSSPE